MKHTIEDFNDVMRYAIDLAEYYRTAKTPHRKILKEYLSECLTDVPVDTLPAARQENAFFAQNQTESPLSNSRVLRKKLKRHARAVEELKICGNDKSIAAKNLGVSLRTFYRWLEDDELKG